jgi:hypothetical protein
MKARIDMAEPDRIARLAKLIDSEIKKDHRLRLTEPEVTSLRRKGAIGLHSICAGFVDSVNRQLSGPVIEFSPPEYAEQMFHESQVNLFQVNAQGRVIQIVFKSTPTIFSTEKFKIPYILEGEVHAYNQEMLERTQIRSVALFFCLEESGNTWRYFDWLHGDTGTFGKDQLVSLLERLV